MESFLLDAVHLQYSSTIQYHTVPRNARVFSYLYLFYPVGYSLLLEQQPDLFAVGAPSRVIPVEDDARLFGRRENKTMKQQDS